MDFRNEIKRDTEPFCRAAADGRFSPDLAPACMQRRPCAARPSCGGDVRGAQMNYQKGAQCSCPVKTKGAICENVQQEINTLPLAMVYSPEQKFEGIKDVCCALEVGTIFDALDKPFCGVCGARGGRK